jgi:signal peptidase II
MSRKKWLPFLLVLFAVLGLDQLSKAWILTNVPLGSSLQPIPFLYPYFQITFSTNTGAAFGIFPDASVLFLLIAIVVCSVIVYFYMQSPSDAHLLHVALALVVGGAVGNVIDRLQHGYVVDFVHLTIPRVVSNVSNFADHAIVLGVILLVIDNILKERQKKRALAPNE